MEETIKKLQEAARAVEGALKDLENQDFVDDLEQARELLGNPTACLRYAAQILEDNPDDWKTEMHTVVASLRKLAEELDAEEDKWGPL